MSNTTSNAAADKARVETVLPLFRQGKTTEAQAMDRMIDSLVAQLTVPSTVQATVSTKSVRGAGSPDQVLELFNKSGLFSRTLSSYAKAENHNPFLVLYVNNGEVTATVVNTQAGLYNYSDDTKVIVRWPGKERSDFFVFTVGQLRAWVAYRSF